MATPRYQLTVILIFLAVACASGPPDPTRPLINIEEVTGPRDIPYAIGPFDVQFELQVANRATWPITLRRVELVSTGGGGAYSLRRESYVFRQTIAPGTQGAVKFWAHAYANYYPGDPGSNSPVSVRAIAIFDTPKGSTQQIVMKVLSQFPE